MKSKRSSAAPRDATPGEVRFCNYYIEMPDGDTWSDYTHIVGGLNAWIINTAIFRANPEAASSLLKSGEYHWKDHNKVLHRMVISNTPCERKRFLRQMKAQNFKSI